MFKREVDMNELSKTWMDISGYSLKYINIVKGGLIYHTSGSFIQLVSFFGLWI